MSSLLDEHFGYLSDAVKLQRYGQAIAAVVRDGDVVVDLGCGSGVLGLACLRAGARFVHFIDKTPFLEVARRTVIDAGYGTQASFHRAKSQHVTLPERADVVICDHVGHFGIDYSILGTLLDAKLRFLKPGGTIVPSELRLSVAAVESERYRAFVGDWRGDRIPADYHWLGDLAVGTKHIVTLTSDELLSAPVAFATVVPGDERQSFYSWTASLEAVRDGHLDGLAGWFDCRLAPEVSMTNSPLALDRVQRAQAFLPLKSPVAVRTGEPLRVTVMTRPGDHVLSWVVELPATGQRFAHSTWEGMLIEPHDLRHADRARIAALSPQGRARQIVLGYCDGTRSLQAVEEQVLKSHPDLFPSADEISAFVAQVLGTDTGP